MNDRLGVHDAAGVRSGQVRPVRFRPPADLPQGKAIAVLGKTDLLRAAVQVVREGGETNLHSHSGMDLFYFVLAGRARFYGSGDAVVGEFEAGEGVIIPRGQAYWFESAGTEPLHLLQVGAFDPNGENRRVDHAARTRDLEATTQILAEK